MIDDLANWDIGFNHFKMDNLSALLSMSERDQSFPLSPLQQGMLLQHLAAEHSGVDIEQVVIELKEQVDATALKAAWEETLQSEPALRTEFVWNGLEVPVQTEKESVRLPFSATDLRHLDSKQALQQIEEYLRGDRSQGFDLQCAPLMRCKLFTLADNEHHLIWTFHHILLDRQSLSLVLKQVFERYRGIHKADLSDHRSGDYLREHLTWMEDLDTPGAAEFWRNKLQDVTSPTPLPLASLDVKRSEDHIYGEVTLELDSTLTASLEDLAAASGLTLNNLVLGAWAILLHRYSGEQELIFGASKTIRQFDLPGVESMIGMFSATLPIRLNVMPGQKFNEILEPLRDYWDTLRGREQTPLAEIKRASSIPANMPLFESLVTFESNRLEDVWSDCNRQLRLQQQTNYPLTLRVDGGACLLLKLQFDAQRFERHEPDQLLNHLRIIFEHMSLGLEGSIDDFALVTPEEQRQILHDFNATERTYPQEASLASLIEAQVQRTPDATAIIFGEQTLTYCELNERANQLAHELQKNGVEPGQLIGLYVDRSAEMIIGLLAIVKAGAGYLPIDPFLPADRLQFMLDDSAVEVVVTQHDLHSRLPRFSGRPVFLDDMQWRSNSEDNCNVSPGPDGVAYVLYTSGSTGRPKGVRVPQSALLNLLHSMREWLQLTEQDRLLAVTTISFDIAGVDMWLPLLTGAQIVLATREEASDGEQLQELLIKHRITFLQATPVT